MTTSQIASLKKYLQKIGSHQPGCIYLMGDVSGSMFGSFAGTSDSKIQVVEWTINELIERIVGLCKKEGVTMDRIYLGVVTYGLNDAVVSLGAKWISEWEEDGESKPTDSKDNIQFVKLNGGGGTPMGAAFKHVYEDLENVWLPFEMDRDGQKVKMKDSFPPVIINISDGMAGDSQVVDQYVQKIKAMPFTDGAPLIYNVSVPEMKSDEVLLPNDLYQMSSGGQYAEYLYKISSEVPANLHDQCRAQGLNPSENCRGVAMNVSSSNLLKFLSFGSLAAFNLND